MYNKPRVIPVLTLQDGDLVKTTQFKNPRYIGDPINTVKIFNDKGVDELCILDITASKEGKEPDFDLLQKIANEAFMPLSYGGGLTSLEQVKKIIRMGYEKVIFNTSFFENPKLILDSVNYLGSSGVVISLDIKKDLLSKYKCYTNDGNVKQHYSLDEIIQKLKDSNAGEVIVNSISHDGMMEGYNLELVYKFSSLLNIPIIALGGAKDTNDFRDAMKMGAHAVAASSMFIFYGKKRSVLINIPNY